MLKKIANAEEKFRELLVMALPVAVALIYLYLECGFSDILSGIAPSVTVGLMLLVISMACRSYKKEESPQVKNKKRNIAVVWIIILVICCCSAWTDNPCLLPSYVWSEACVYLKRAVYLAWPVLLLFFIRMVVMYVPEGISFAVQRQSLLYYAAALSVIWLITANYGSETGLWNDRVDEVFYLLVLADIIIWNEIYRKLELTGSRIRASLFMLAVNAGVFIFLFARNGRMREIFYSPGFPLAGYNGMIQQTDWAGYRKAAIQAFLTKDLTVLRASYQSEHYGYVLYRDGLASIRFEFGIMPLVFMIVFLILEAVLLWNWKRRETAVNKYARYLVTGYGIRIVLALIMEVCMFQISHVKFPFTGEMDGAEIILPILLIFGCRTVSDRRACGFSAGAKNKELL